MSLGILLFLNVLKLIWAGLYGIWLRKSVDNNVLCYRDYLCGLVIDVVFQSIYGLWGNKLQQNFSHCHSFEDGPLSNILKIPQNPLRGTRQNLAFQIGNFYHRVPNSFAFTRFIKKYFLLRFSLPNRPVRRSDEKETRISRSAYDIKNNGSLSDDAQNAR